jgi:hypothetical protein
MSRLKLLRNNTMGPFVAADVLDIGRLRKMNERQLRKLGRVPFPMIYRPGDRGFSRVSWSEALGLIGERLGKIPPTRQAWFATSKGITNETYYAFTKAARAMGTNNVDFCARLCHAATVSGLKSTIGVGAPDDLALRPRRRRPHPVVGHKPREQPARLGEVPRRRQGPGRPGRRHQPHP